LLYKLVLIWYVVSQILAILAVARADVGGYNYGAGLGGSVSTGSSSSKHNKLAEQFKSDGNAGPGVPSSSSHPCPQNSVCKL